VDSSTKVFHWPQSLHRPSHFGLWDPQDWQTNFVLGLLKESYHPSASILATRAMVKPGSLTGI